MAEPMSIIAGISSVTSLADVSCSLAGSLYKAFRAIKDAPHAIKRLSKELEQLDDVLQDVDKLLQRYSTSLIVSEDGLSIDSVQSVLQECQTELGQVQKIFATFKDQPGKLKNAAARFRWVVDEPKIKQHCQTVEQLRQHINTELSVLSHQYDIKARERDKSLHSQVTEVRNVVDTSATETRNLVSSEFGTVRSDIEQVAVKVAHSQEGLQTNIQTSHDHLRQEVSLAGIRTSLGIERIQNDLQDTNLLVQRNRQHTMQEFLQLKQSIKTIDSMLSQAVHLFSEREDNLLNCSLAQHPQLEGIMLSLLMMKSSLVSAISELKSKSSLDISEEESEFLLNEFENLVAFSHDASALRIRQRCIRAEGEERPTLGSTNHTSMARNYVLDVDSFSQPTVTRRRRLRRLYHADASGILKLRFEERAGNVNGRPASVLNASFSYIPNFDVHKTGVYATFRKEMRMGFNPSINRSLRVIRVFDRSDSTINQVFDVLRKDNLHGLQRMLSCALGQAVNADLIHVLLGFRGNRHLASYYDLCRFLIDQGADIEYRDLLTRETPLLIIAEADDITNVDEMQVFLRLTADYSAVDYKGRGPLHLALKPSREALSRPVRRLFPIQLLDRHDLKEKLVHLLQAGCSIHAVDNYGRTPTDVARKWRRKKAWEAALQEVGKLECGRSECRCEIVTEDSVSSFVDDRNSHSAASEDSEIDDLYDDLPAMDDEKHDRLTEIAEDTEQHEDANDHKDQQAFTDEAEREDENQELAKSEDEALDSDPELAGGEQSARNEDNLNTSALSTPHVSKPALLPVPEPHHETIALGQHHLWMI